MTANHLNTEAERAAFEAWYLREAGESRAFTLGKNSAGEYAYAETESMWMAWEERARRTPTAADGAALDLPPLPMRDVCGGDEAFGDNVSGFSDEAMQQFGRDAIAHYLSKQAGDGSNVAPPFAAPAGQHDATEGETLDQKAENALLWCYRRLKNSYGRLPFVEEAVAGLRERTAAAGAARQGGITSNETCSDAAPLSSAQPAQGAVPAKDD